ncbi:hypothetical protein AAVH_01501 [Aphelenchoides avenae]|nr:hypothetical protein AAVH_01501 [Aphelenchus avenae]
MKTLLLAAFVAIVVVAYVEACGSASSGGSSPPPPSGGGGRKRRSPDDAVATIVSNLEYNPATLEDNLKVLQKQLKHIAEVNNIKAGTLGKVDRKIEPKDGFIALVYTIPSAVDKCGQLAALTEKAVQQSDAVNYGSLACGGQNYEFSH